jgi:AcrR family transcriptional regulator
VPADAAPRRPRQPPEVRRAQILDAARKLFADNGFHATTTREIAAAADLNDGLLYRHFQDKQAILDALVTEALDAFATLPPLDGGAPLREILVGIGDAFVRIATEQLDLLTILLTEHGALRADDRFTRFIDGAATGLGRLLAARLPAVDPDHGYLLARGYLGSLVSFLLLQKVLGMDRVRAVDAGEYVRAQAARYADHGKPVA